jgi:hypothetical protein
LRQQRNIFDSLARGLLSFSGHRGMHDLPAFVIVLRRRQAMQRASVGGVTQPIDGTILHRFSNSRLMLLP